MAAKWFNSKKWLLTKSILKHLLHSPNISTTPYGNLVFGNVYLSAGHHEEVKLSAPHCHNVSCRYVRARDAWRSENWGWGVIMRHASAAAGTVFWSVMLVTEKVYEVSELMNCQNNWNWIPIPVAKYQGSGIQVNWQYWPICVCNFNQ